MNKLISIGVLLLLLTGCGSTLPDNLRAQAEQNLVRFEQVLPLDHQADADSADLTDVANLNSPYLNQQARWGGLIAKVSHLKNQSVIEVVNLELYSNGKPRVSQQSNGRFRVYINGFIDPILFKEGKLVTALGDFVGTEAGSIGDFNYQFPTLKNAQVHLWKDIRPVERSIVHRWPFFYDDYYHSWHYFHDPYNRRRIRGFYHHGGYHHNNNQTNNQTTTPPSGTSGGSQRRSEIPEQGSSNETRREIK